MAVVRYIDQDPVVSHSHGSLSLRAPRGHKLAKQSSALIKRAFLDCRVATLLATTAYSWAVADNRISTVFTSGTVPSKPAS